MYTKLESLKRQIQIESLKSFQRLSYKTQVTMPKHNTYDITMNRLTHSYLVKAGSEIICSNILLNGIDVDYKFSVGNVSLTHDIGQAPFGHAGAYTISDKIKEYGLKDGFDDNSNNYKVIFKNGGYNMMSDYEIASLMKYPNKLYSEQTDYLLPILERAINDDIKHFGNKGIKIYNRPERTIACNIMDEADRNAYVCSDLADFFTLRFNKKSSFRDDSEQKDHKTFSDKILDNKYNDVEITAILYAIKAAIKNKNTNLVRSTFNHLFYLLNTNYYIGNNIELKSKNPELETLREDLFDLERELYINNHFVVKENEKNKTILSKYVDYVIENEFYTSKTYSQLISKSYNEKQKLIYIRDMIGECTDWYIHQKAKELKL